MILRIKFLEFSKKFVAIFPVIILKLAIVLKGIIMSSSFETEGMPTDIFGKKRTEQTGYEGGSPS